MYKCECCNCRFLEPYIVKFSENLDGERGIEKRSEESCPKCGSEWFTEVKEDEDF